MQYDLNMSERRQDAIGMATDCTRDVDIPAKIRLASFLSFFLLSHILTHAGQ